MARDYQMPWNIFCLLALGVTERLAHPVSCRKLLAALQEPLVHSYAM